MDKSRILVATDPIEREVTFTDGTVEKCHFRQVTGAQWRRWAESERHENQEVRLHAMQLLIAASLCDEIGRLVLTEEEATRLTVTGINDLFPHVVEVSRGSQEVKKD